MQYTTDSFQQLSDKVNFITASGSAINVTALTSVFQSRVT